MISKITVGVKQAQQAQQAGSLGLVGEQVGMIAGEPAVEAKGSPLKVRRMPSVTSSEGHSLARGCLTCGAKASSTLQNKAMINSEVDKQVVPLLEE